VRASRDASASAAAALTAAVRISVTSRPSIIASRAPVSGSNSSNVAKWVGRPRSEFPGARLTALIAAARDSGR